METVKLEIRLTSMMSCSEGDSERLWGTALSRA